MVEKNPIQTKLSSKTVYDVWYTVPQSVKNIHREEEDKDYDQDIYD